MPALPAHMARFRVFRDMDWWLVLMTSALAAFGILFIHSATQEGSFGNQAARQVLFFAASGVLGLGVLLVPYPRIMRSAWALYLLAVLALALLPFFGSMRNGSRRWFDLFSFSVQPSEFAKLAVILALASWLRFRSKARTFEGLIVPVLITAVPVGLVLMQPDLGSSLVFWPILLAMCYAGGTPTKSLLGLIALGVLALGFAFAFGLQDYQRERFDTWVDHWSWDEAALDQPEVANQLRGPAYQPWQSLIAIGAGGWDGFGYGDGPQNRFGFLPYRSGDYIFAVVAEELGYLGVLLLLSLQLALVATLFGIAARSRERFGRLLGVGVGTWLGVQSLLHIAVCAWLVPATGLPLPLLSHGGSSTLAAVLGIALALNVSARRELVLSRDGFL